MGPGSAADVIAEGIHPRDGKPWVHPPDRAAWRTWLIANHATSSGVHLVSWRRGSGHEPLAYAAAVEEALCVGWIDSKAGTLDADRSTLWMSPRRPDSGWSRPNKERVERLRAAGQMLPPGQAAIDEAIRRGSWTLLDDVEDLVVPDDLEAALEGIPGARAAWDALRPGLRKQLLTGLVTAKRPETRARRVAVAVAAAIPTADAP